MLLSLLLFSLLYIFPLSSVRPNAVCYLTICQQTAQMIALYIYSSPRQGDIGGCYCSNRVFFIEEDYNSTFPCRNSISDKSQVPDVISLNKACLLTPTIKHVSDSSALQKMFHQLKVCLSFFFLLGDYNVIWCMVRLSGVHAKQHIIQLLLVL